MLELTMRQTDIFFVFVLVIYSKLMSTSTNEVDVIPECLCGGGKMNLFCAGKDAIHSGRYFYKCPTNEKHLRSFLWCDGYHSKIGDDKQPNFVLNQEYRPAKTVRNNDAEKKKGYLTKDTVVDFVADVKLNGG